MAVPDRSYDADFFAWTQDQADALRRLPARAVGNDVDLQHVAEEIEDLGKRDLRDVESFLRRMFEHLLKIAYHPTSPDRVHWIGEIENFQAEACGRYKPSMAQYLDLKKAWRLGRRTAFRLLVEMGISAEIPEDCPFRIEELIAEEFDLQAAALRLTAPPATTPAR